MKLEDILAMPAGRELDALVADKVMGWEVRGRYFMTPEGIRTHEETSYSGFSPSISISAAWEAVEKLCENEDVKFGIDRNYSIKNMWVAGFNYNHGSYAGHTATTAPEAICKAALLTVLEESL